MKLKLPLQNLTGAYQNALVWKSLLCLRIKFDALDKVTVKTVQPRSICRVVENSNSFCIQLSNRMAFQALNHSNALIPQEIFEAFADQPKLKDQIATFICMKSNI